MEDTPRATVVGIVTPHVLRIVDLASEAEKGVNVDWHVREAVAGSMRALGELYNASVAVASYIDGLVKAAGQPTGKREAYVRVLQSAAEAARRLRRD